MLPENKDRLLAKWLWTYFWLFIPNIIVSLMEDFFAGSALEVAVMALSIALTIYRCWIFLKLAPVSKRYMTAGICELIAEGISFFSGFLPYSAGEFVSVFLSIPALILSVAAMYNTYHAHSEVLSGENKALSEKWITLWKWSLGFMITVFAAMIFAFIVDAIAAILLFVSGIGMLVIGIVELIYIYKTADVFRLKCGLA